jgi:hypothetical protein
MHGITHFIKCLLLHDVSASIEGKLKETAEEELWTLEEKRYDSLEKTA